MTPARVLVADPPWKFGDSLPGKGRGAAKHYRCLTIGEILRFKLPPIADDAVLFLWRVSSMPEEAMRVVRWWNFEPKSEIVWNKTTKTGKRHFGMGRIVRAEHETCIIATRGRPEAKRHDVRSTFDAPIGEHSQKPEQFFDLVESLFDGPYVELFARRERPGWTCLGDALQPAPQFHPGM